MTPERRSSWIRLCLIGLWILAGLQIANMAIHPFLNAIGFETIDENHWDFRVYLAAHDVFRQGGNPLNLAELKSFGIGIPYNYSPAFTRATMWFFDGDPQTVELRFIIVKILAILLGFEVLVKGFRLKGAWVPIAAFLTTFGFGSGLLVDMAAGNITALEFLWISLLAVGAYRRWDLMFLPALFLLCLGKPIWGIFAAVPVLLYWDARAWRTFGFACGVFLLPLALSAGISGAETKQYLRASFGFREVGWINPCLREFLTEAMTFMGVGGRTATLTWAIFSVSTLAGVGWMRSRLKGDLGVAFGASAMLLLPCILPRFKPYAYALLIPFLLLSLTVRRPDARTLRNVILLATAPFLGWITLTLVGTLDGYEYGLLHILGYFPLALAVATFFVLNPAAVAQLRQGEATLRGRYPIIRPLALAAVGLLVIVAFTKESKAFRNASDDRKLHYSTDLDTYVRVASGVRGGGTPYRDVTFEYPPTVGYYLAAPAPGPDFTRRQYFDRFVTFTAILCASALLIFGVLALKAVGARRLAGVGLLTILLLGVPLELTFLRFDAPVALITACGGLLMLLGQRSRRAAGLGSVVLGIGAGLKLYPIILLAALVRSMSPAARRIALLGAGLGLLPSLVLAAMGRNGVGVFLHYHSRRHVEMGSFWGVVGRSLGSWRRIDAFGSSECRFALETVVIPLSTLMTGAAVVAPFLLLRKNKSWEVCLRVGILALYGFVFFNKVGSPQYAFWLFGASLIGIVDRKRFWPTIIASGAGVLAAADSMSNYNVSNMPLLVAFVNLKVFVWAIGYGVAAWALRDAVLVERLESQLSVTK